ncbi:NACHT domain-containing protein [Lentzea sp. CA-135723]|uniref:NACHT domain-containing protein n=1 Tax=Lentzea sp. CA-135723 TaxID=3239950 RepID=UPI003D8DE787
MASVDAAVGRIVVSVSNQLATRLSQLVPPAPADVDPVLLSYLESPDFAEVARQVVLWRTMRGALDPALAADLREQIVQGLRHAGASADPAPVLGALADAPPLRADDLDVPTAVAVTHLANAAMHNRLLLRRAPSLADFHAYARQLNRQVVATHAEMRLPHVGVSRSVPYRELYVRPTLNPQLSVDDLVLPGRRTVLLGDPGAGKSTLAAKLAHDLASSSDRVPFLLVLRDFTPSFRAGGRELLRYFEQVCRDPYNLSPAHDCVEYLLRNGRAIVVLDGLDELVEPELRRRVVRLIEGFAHQYPLTPIVVTARKVGYAEAPLSTSLFAQGTVDEFDTEQVTAYVSRWFALDAATPVSRRARLASSFVAESAEIAELRRNPLLLALLCAMYSSEHYLPRNLAQVYERCAVMLFDRWDSMRGIALPVQFQGRLRGAVQHLAWALFTSPESGKALPRSRIVHLLARYLVSKSFDTDDALAAAEEFADFCTGRAWILTDVGATRVEPLFGFTHRTFMEYFAAEHLVRKHTDTDSLWQALGPHVAEGAWDVVSRIALQLHDRNVDDGADDVLTLAMRDGCTAFAANALQYVAPRPALVDRITRACLHEAMSVPTASRVTYSTSFLLVKEDLPVQMCLRHSLPANTPFAHRALLDEAAVLASDPEFGSFLLGVLGCLDQEPELQAALRDLRLHPPSGTRPWLSSNGLSDLDFLVSLHGPKVLFEHRTYLGGILPAPVCTLLSSQARTFDGLQAEELADLIVQQSDRPWISAESWSRTYDPAWAPELTPHDVFGADLNLLLCLPYLERLADHSTKPPFEVTPDLGHLAEARATSGRWSRPPDLSSHAAHLLLRWVAKDFSVFE